MGSGRYDEKGHKKEDSPEDKIICGEKYFLADKSVVWRAVEVDGIEVEETTEGKNGTAQEGWAICRPLGSNGSKLESIRVNIKDMLPPSPCNPAVVDDVTSLHYIHEAAILENLKLRFRKNPPIPYTYMCNVLIAVNPLRRDIEFYSSSKYASASTVKLFQYPPHPYGLAESVLRQMKQVGPLGTNQAIVISGESGAGKTESFKVVLNHLLTSVAGTEDGAPDDNGSGVIDLGEGGTLRRSSMKTLETMQKLEKRLHETNPLMECIGNARTTRNHNSSRFGKFLKLVYENHSPPRPPPLTMAQRRAGVVQTKRPHYDMYKLSCAQIETYLLEKTRITSQSAGEGNFHIFYALLAACVDPEDGGRTFACVPSCESSLMYIYTHISCVSSFVSPPSSIEPHKLHCAHVLFQAASIRPSWPTIASSQRLLVHDTGSRTPSPLRSRPKSYSARHPNLFLLSACHSRGWTRCGGCWQESCMWATSRSRTTTMRTTAVRVCLRMATRRSGVCITLLHYGGCLHPRCSSFSQ